MKTLTIFVAAALTFGSVTVHAQESVVERAVGQFVEKALTKTKSELSAKLQQSISNTAFHFSLNNENAKGKVEVTELVAVSPLKKEKTVKRTQ
ncbi:hypothetical protein [Alteromonas sp. ASW11-130]|uniref:hypothetical protein n=1 Tax=Alteromonas sp. ASW11-130 TaxID=3015775 RepID=UPI002241A818|nr:hypothetical protein [Alteromonas sp. ASW11-130]MCW8092688.1 hypothetical protein [Alteromonas sp. ASW11-130]